MSCSDLPGEWPEPETMRAALKTVDEMSAGTAMTIGFCGQELLLDPAGIAFLPATDTLLVADLHLEKGSSFARRRQYLPPYDTAATLARLGALIAKYDPKTVVSLGDSFHDDEASRRLSDDASAAISAMATGRRFIWITGNHDPSPPANVAGEAALELALDGITFRHIPQAGHASAEISGHLHPCAKIRVRGRSVRRPCFASDGNRLIMPSFGVYSGGLNVLDAAFDGLFNARRFCTYMLGSDRIYAMAPKNLVAD